MSLQLKEKVMGRLKKIRPIITGLVHLRYRLDRLRRTAPSLCHLTLKSLAKRWFDLAKKDKKVFAVTAAMPEGTGLAEFSQVYPERFMDVGLRNNTL